MWDASFLGKRRLLLALIHTSSTGINQCIPKQVILILLKLWKIQQRHFFYHQYPNKFLYWRRCHLLPGKKNFRVSVHYRLPTIPLIVPCSKEMHKYAKITCLSVIPTGIKLFQTDIINNYAVSCNGLQRSMSRSTTPRFIYLPLFKLQRERERESEVKAEKAILHTCCFGIERNKVSHHHCTER